MNEQKPKNKTFTTIKNVISAIITIALVVYLVYQMFNLGVFDNLFNSEPLTPTLKTPQNVTYNDDTYTLTWDAVDGADGYIVFIEEGDSADSTYSTNVDVSTNSFDYLVTHQYTSFCVQATDSTDTQYTSTKSKQCSYTIPPVSEKFSLATVSSYVDDLLPGRSVEKIVSMYVADGYLHTTAVMGDGELYKIQSKYETDVTSIEDAMNHTDLVAHWFASYELAPYDSAKYLLQSDNFSGEKENSDEETELENRRQEGWNISIVASQTVKCDGYIDRFYIYATYKLDNGVEVKYVQSQILAFITNSSTTESMNFTTKLLNESNRILEEFSYIELTGDEFLVAHWLDVYNNGVEKVFTKDNVHASWQKDQDISNHKLVNGVCSCGYKTKYEKLRYKLNAGGNSYCVCDVRFGGTEMEIPTTYLGKPITTIENGIFGEDLQYNDCLYFGNEQNKYLVLVKANDQSMTNCTINQNTKIIYHNAFSGCTGLTSITIPQSVTSIGSDAFSRCGNLTTVTFGDNSQLETIGDYAFYGCTGLTSIVIPNSVTSIGNYAFKNCTKLTSITIPDSVTSIGNYAFYGCTGLTSITIPQSVTSIGKYAFSKCYNLSQISLSNNLTEIKEFTFYECKSLKSISVPDSVEIIGYSAFRECTALEYCNITVTKIYAIDSCAFLNCSSLTNIAIPGDVTIIGGYAFSGCTNLTHVTFYFGDTLEIEDYAFEGCTGLTNITIPDWVKSIGSQAFKGCTGLTNISVDEDNKAYHSSNNCLIKGSTLVLGCQSSVIPTDGSVTSIGDYAFTGCTGLTSITIPQSVTSIGSDAFSRCGNLTTVTFGDNSQLETIGDYAFYGCTGLTSIVIPNSVTSIGNYAFKNCTELTSITIPDSVTSIGNYAFYGCTNLQYNEYDNGLYLGNDTNKHLVFVDTKNTSIESCAINSNTKVIGDHAFNDCTELTSITILDSVTSIGSYAFCDCTKLESITFDGTKKQWYAISKDSYWNGISTPDISKIVCTDGTVSYN